MPAFQKKSTNYISSWITGLKARLYFNFLVYCWMITDVIHVVLALPSQHLIFGIISTVLCIAAAWVYSHGSNKLKTIILETISWLAVFNEIVFQLNMVYYGIWSYRTSMPLEMCYLSALLVPVYTRFQHYRSLQNWFFFAGFGGSFFALINTNLSEMAQIYISIHYFFAHGLVIFVMLALVIDGYRPRWVDYFNAIKWTTSLFCSSLSLIWALEVITCSLLKNHRGLILRCWCRNGPIILWLYCLLALCFILY